MATRSNVYCRLGAAAASQPLAVSAATSILKSGGSAFDAGIAASAVLAVVEPGASHLGGDGFLIYYESATKKTTALNGSGEAPHNATGESFAGQIPLHGFRSATVPGLVSTWFAGHQRWGRLPIAQLLEPAIEYAEQGFPANLGFIRRIALHKEQFPKTPVFEQMGISTDLSLGDLVVQPDLANTLKIIAREGRSGFYQGAIAEAISKDSDGWFNQSDFDNHFTRVSDPLTISYRGFSIHGQPPPTQGMILMSELLLAERADFANLTLTDQIHLLVEAKKIGFADRNRVLGDYEGALDRVLEVLTETHISKRFAEIDMKRANNEPVGESEEGSDTTYFLTADGEGNAVSWIQSVFHGFGASWAVKGTGILLNNRLTGFSLNPKSTNFIAPGKRPAHTLNAFIVTDRSEDLFLVGGTPGANIQVQTNAQIITNVIDRKMNSQEAIDAPRWQHLAAPGSSSLDENYLGTLQLEDRFDPTVIEDLTRRGHKTELLPAFGHGSAVQLLKVLPSKSYEVGSDPRAEGHASGV